MAAGREHLMIEQHAAIWSGACVPLAGVPLFWWWQVVDENDLYSRYTAVKKFMTDIDPREPLAKRVKVDLVMAEKGNPKLLKQWAALGTADPASVRGYVYPLKFARSGETPLQIEYVSAVVEGMTPGIFRVEVFNTDTGVSLRRFDVRASEGKLEIPLPQGLPDCAFKAKLLTPLVAKPAPAVKP